MFSLVISTFLISPRLSSAQQTDTVTIKIWWPDTLIPLDAREVLDAEFENFEAVADVPLEVRRRVYLEGDFARQLSLTEQVAPNALPDLVLMRRADLVDAARAGVIVPIENWLPVSLRDMPDNQRAFGTVDGDLYGLTYLLEFQHSLYPLEMIPTYPASFDEVLAQQTQLLFPAIPLEGRVISNYFLLQYVAAGGAFFTDNGTPSIDQEVALEILNFYAEARDAGLLDVCLIEGENCLLAYDTPRDYWTTINDTEPIIAVIDSHLYLQRRDTRFVDFVVQPMITLNGNPTTLMDGWVWVLVTTDPVRQQEARKFIEWMTISDNMATIATALDMIPSQPTALRVMEDENYMELAEELMENALFISEEERRGVAALALQTAFEAVLEGATPDEALDLALESMAQS